MKQVSQFAFRAKRFSQRFCARVLISSGATALVRSFCADPPNYPTQSALSVLPDQVCRASRNDALIAAGVVSALSCAKSTFVETHSLVIPAFYSFSVSHQNGIHERRRAFTTHAMETFENQLDEPPHIVKPLNVSTLYTHKAQASTERLHDAESEIMLQQDALLLEGGNLDSTTPGELSEDDESQVRADAEKNFYNLIEAEDSPDELLSMLLNLEEVLPSSDPRVCHTCLRLAKLCNDINQKPEKVLDYARQAFYNFDSSRFPLESARALFLVGMGHFNMGDVNEAVNALEKCASQIERLPLPKTGELNVLQYDNQILLGQAKVSLGRNFDGLLEFKKALAVMEKALSPGSPRLAVCCQEIALALLQAKQPKEALSLCKEALLTFSKHFGHCSLQVAELRSLMLQIYYELGDHESVLSECQLSVQIFLELGERDKAVSLDLESMQAFFLLGKFNEAVTKLKEIIKRTQEEDPLHLEALILLVRACNGLKDNAAAAEYSQRALNSLDEKELTFDSAKTLIRLSTSFQQLQNYDQALAISQRALNFFENCVGEEREAYAADAQGYRGSLLLSIGRPNEAILHLEKALKMKKNIYGSENGELLDVCNHLGVAYAHAKRVDKALAVFQEAKMILNTIEEGANLMSVYIYNNLSLTFTLSGRIEEAIDSKKHSIKLMRQVGKQVLCMIDEAEKELESLIEGTKNDKIVSINEEQILKQMLPSYITSCTQDKAVI